MPSIETPNTPAAWRSRVLYLSVPIMLSNVTVPLVGIVDTAVMGRMASPAYLSATAMGAVIFSSLYWAFGFLQMGTSGLVSRAIGENQLEQAKRTVIRALTLAALLGALLILAKSQLLVMGLWAMQGSSAVHTLTADYFSIRILSAPGTLMLYAILGALIGQQSMRTVFALQLILNLLNIALNILFFNVTEWNIKGIAIATVISEYTTMAVGLTILRSRSLNSEASSRLVKNSGLWWKIVPQWLLNRDKLKELFNISGNLFVRTLCLTGAYYWLVVMSSRQGDVLLAANAILIQMLHFMAYGLDGFAMAAETLTGHAYGRRNRAALVNAVTAVTQLAALLALAFTLVYTFAGEALIDLMTTQSVVQQLAREWLLWITFAPLVGVWSFLLDGIFIGTTHTQEMRNAMLISVSIFIAATLILVPIWQNTGLWLAYYILLIARTLTLSYYYPRILSATNHRAV